MYIKHSIRVSGMRILIIGSGFAPIHKKLKLLGHRLFIIPDPKRKINLNEDNLYDGINFPENEDDIELLARNICINKTIFSIDRVIAFNEKWQQIAARVAVYAELPIITDEQLVNRTVDKYLMRKHLEMNNFLTIKFEKIAQYSDLAPALTRVGFPAILKPLSGEASRDILLIHDEESYHQLEPILCKKINETFILESFVSGDEYSVEAVSYHHQHHILAITKKYKNDQFVEVGHVLPAPLTAGQEDQISKYIQNFLHTMNFNNTPSHTEIIISNMGPVVIESHTRPGGDNIYRLLEYSTGIDLMNLVAKINTESVEESDLCKRKDCCYSAIWYSSPEGNDNFVLDSVHGLEEARNRNNIKNITMLTKPGDTARSVTNSFDRSAFAIATGATANEALSTAQDALSEITLTYKYCKKQKS
ncbi:hypothetical protein KP22_07950 [Pectobacterium betavasculorum]|uniref:ATP-grasp domain-containing protein n=2 Tax=Pectobacterium betavasculorum TaxID=55207 RepID=A0A093RRK6_9GAMM|nr:hypothetical protein KP22_07950 [Pectobacterium betavasculorum]